MITYIYVNYPIELSAAIETVLDEVNRPNAIFIQNSYMILAWSNLGITTTFTVSPAGLPMPTTSDELWPYCSMYNSSGIAVSTFLQTNAKRGFTYLVSMPVFRPIMPNTENIFVQVGGFTDKMCITIANVFKPTITSEDIITIGNPVSCAAISSNHNTGNLYFLHELKNASGVVKYNSGYTTNNSWNISPVVGTYIYQVTMYEKINGGFDYHSPTFAPNGDKYFREGLGGVPISSVQSSKSTTFMN